MKGTRNNSHHDVLSLTRRSVRLTSFLDKETESDLLGKSISFLPKSGGLDYCASLIDSRTVNRSHDLLRSQGASFP